MILDENKIYSFIKESNAIEDIFREPLSRELSMARLFLGLENVTLTDLETIVYIMEPGAVLRRHVGMNVSVGKGTPIFGGPEVVVLINSVLLEMNQKPKQAHELHRVYETLHPFMDCNGRSGRLLWAWMHIRTGFQPVYFLKEWYYESLRYEE